MHDILLRNGTLIDPGIGLHKRADLAITGPRISGIIQPGEPAPAKRILDVSGLLVMPGFIDLHVHVFSGVSHYGIDVDPTCLARGVTTAVDAGSSGSLTFPGFRKYIIDVCGTRLFAMLNISAVGMVSGQESTPNIGELEDLRFCDVKAATRMIEANRDRILGVKVRLSDFLAAKGKNELGGMLAAREAADAVGLPLMVHTPNSGLPLERILAEMRPGDVLTHCFHGHRCGIVDKDFNVPPFVRKKIEEGLLLDVGHGKGSFTFQVGRAALAQGVLPNTISSDLHRYNLTGPVYDLATTLSKFLHLGVSIDEAVRRTTTTPAKFVRMENEIGTLRAGAFADVAVMELKSGDFALTDTFGVVETGKQMLEPRYVFRGGSQVGVLPRPE